MDNIALAILPLPSGMFLREVTEISEVEARPGRVWPYVPGGGGQWDAKIASLQGMSGFLI